MAASHLPTPRQTGFTRSTEVPLYWARHGEADAPALLLVHGGPGADHEYLLPQMLELAKGHDLVFYDQRGGGRSRATDASPITWRTHVADLDRVIEELGLAGRPIVGYSWGALLSMLFAIELEAGRVQHRPIQLALLDPAPVTRAFRRQFEAEFARRQAAPAVHQARAELSASGLRERDPEAFRRRAFALSVAAYFYDATEARDLTPFRVISRAQESVWDSLGDYDLTAPGQLDTVRIPALIVHGREDPIPLASSEAAARAMDGRAKLVVIEECGHVPYVEQPAILFAELRSFLDPR